ncbi:MULTISPECIES: YybS family protein [unclassified Pyramidobacter]|uniref:YybS family protein n=1 Tax=unclassified Pyramidobacter TaxID=2632171 RepID=UPI000EA3BDD0|nr:YybS family protein [Pyramidobacter sp. CG50-2]RKJ79386.1 DUF2232 domain-containing protein [Pyramidobacter sp. CG50-2]
MDMTQARGLVESALLTGLSVILYVGADIPVLGLLLALLSPVPLVILEMRHDLRLGFASLIVGSALVLLWGGPIAALSYALGFALMGLSMGRIIELKRSAVEILGWSSLVSLGCKLIMAVLLFYVTGLNPMNLDMSGAQQMMDMMLKLPVGAELSAAVRAQLEATMKIMPLIVPAVLILVAVIDSAACYWITGHVLGRLDRVELPKLPPFSRWRFPSSLMWAFLVGLLCTWAGASYPAQAGFLIRVGLNLDLLVRTLFLIQGMSLAAWYMDRRGLPRIVRNVILVTLAVVPFLSQLATFAGIIDMCWNIRYRFGGDRS